MELLFRYLCFAILLHKVFCDLGDDVVFNILSSRLDYVSITLAKIARKQKALETKLEINANLIGGKNENDYQDPDTGSDSTESGLIEELSVLKKAISSEKWYLRNLEDSIEKKFEAIAAIQPLLGDNRRISQTKFADQIDSTDILRRIQVVEKDFKSVEILANKMEDRIDQVETDIEKVESVTNNLENRTDSIEKNLEFVEQVTERRLNEMEKDVDSIEKESTEIENKLEKVENDIESVETIAHMIKLRVNSVENKIDLVERASDIIDRNMATMESAITVITEAANKKVSFSALYKPPPGIDVVLFKKNNIIPFNLVTNNDGSGFNTTSGIFTVPVSGVYQFIFFVEGWQYDGDITCPAAVVQIFVDHTATTSVAVADPKYPRQHIQSGNQYISELRKGQVVAVGTAATCEKHVIYGYRTTFSGVLLY